MSFKRLIATAAIAAVFTASFAQQQAQVQLSAYPQMSVADGRSTTTISAEIRDSRGNLVPDGTRVVFESTLGNFRDNIVQTRNGIARAVLQAGGIPGVATIKASAADGTFQPSTIEFEFVGDRSMLSAANEFIELVCPTYMEFMPETKIIAAAAPAKGVFVRYRDITIVADDVQINIPRYEIRARKAKLTIGKLSQEFDELYLKLNDKSGIGSTRFKTVMPVPLAMEGAIPRFLTDDLERFKDVGKEVDRYGLVDIKRDNITPAPTIENAHRLSFEETGVYTTSVSAKKAVIFPQKQIQFQRAEILVAGSKVMQMPLYELNLMQTTNNGVMGSMVNVNNNQVQVNYPYYLSLKPGQTSLLRFRTGQRYGRGVSAGGGAFLDYELNWNKGDQSDGKFTIQGIGRRDYIIGAQHYLRIDERTNAFGMVESSASSNVFGSLNLNRMYDGFSVNLNGNMSHTFRGITYTTRDMSLVAEKDPTKVGSLPVRLYYGLTAQENSNTLIGSSQSAVGLRTRLQSLPLNIGSNSTLFAGLSLAHLSGRNTLSGLTVSGELNLTHRLTQAMTLRGTYGYLRDGYNDKFLGQQRVGLEANYETERVRLRVLGSKSLDIQRSSLYGDLQLGISGPWWFTSGYTLDRYLSTDFLDYTFGLGYRVGGREIGLVWSRSTNRIGLQLLGATF